MMIKSQGYLLILIIITSIWSQWGIEPLGLHWTELQTKLFIYDWVPMLIYCGVLLVLALMSFNDKTITFFLTTIALLWQLVDAIGNIIQIPQNGITTFFIAPQLWAIFIVIAFCISVIGTGTWIGQRIRKT